MKRPAQHPEKSRERSGFTLVEMLIVMSIIALLIALLLPSIKRSRQMVRRIQCQSNLRQWMIASVSYAGDESGVLPYAVMQDGDSSGGWTWKHEWYTVLIPYMRVGEHILDCPSATGTYAYAYPAYHINGNVSTRCHTTRKHHDIRSPAPGGDTSHLDNFVQYTRVTRPAMTPFFHDAGRIGGSAYFSLYGFPYSRGELVQRITGVPVYGEDRKYIDEISSDIKFRHLRTASLVMLDGHTELIRGETVGNVGNFMWGAEDNYDKPLVHDELYGDGKPFCWHYRRDPYKVY